MIWEFTPEAYDTLIFDEFQRKFFGEDGFYNLGLRRNGCQIDQNTACRTLVENLIQMIPTDARVICDVGCGLGATTRTLTSLRPSANVVALNYSFAQLQQARLKSPGASIIRGDAIDLPLATGSLDSILCVEAALHFNSRINFLKEAARVLKPGGILAMSDFLETPGFPALHTIPPANRGLSDPRAYASLLLESGFTEIGIEDVLDESWLAFCDAQINWLESAILDEAMREAYTRPLHEMRSTVSHVLLIRAARA